MTGEGRNGRLKESGAEGRIKRTALTRDARRELDQRIAARLLAARLDPYKPSAIGKAGDQSRGYPPDLRARWVFAAIGLSRAAQAAGQITAAAQGRNLSSLRLITLRPSKTRPEPNELGQSLDSLSRDINIHVPYMRAMGWIDTVLSVPQIRLDDNGELDLHLHALWHIAPDWLGRVREHLKERYKGGVWIDDVPIRSLRKTAFYIGSGMLDYPAVPEWPDDVLKAIWKLEHRRMIRPAGWFAAYLKNITDSAAVRNAPERRQEAAGMANRRQDAPHPTQPKDAAPNGNGASHSSSTRGKLGGMEGKKQQSPRLPKGDTNLSTVRPAAPESEFWNPSATPSIDEFWTVLRLLESQRVEGPRETFDEFCIRLSVKPLHVRKAVSRVEAYVEASLFYPGGYWSPTSEGLAFLDKGLPHLQGLDMLAVEIGADARWAREPGRQAFEERIGYANGRSSARSSDDPTGSE